MIVYFLSVVFASLYGYYLMSFTNLGKKYFTPPPRKFLTMGNHEQKRTATSGGIVFIVIALFSLCFFYDSRELYFLVGLSVISGLIGCYDDWNKIKSKSGLRVWPKFLLHLCAIACVIILWILHNASECYVVLGSYQLFLGLWYIMWATFVVVATSHAINITDGIDGLAASQCNIILTAFLLTHTFSDPVYYVLWGINVTLAIFYVIFNRNPAILFMGDSGAFFLGGLISGMFLLFHEELLLPFLGIIFVIETLSVILQSLYYRKYKKRLFLFAPIHHDFEKRGMSEDRIVSIFAKITVLMNAIIYAMRYYFI